MKNIKNRKTEPKPWFIFSGFEQKINLIRKQ